MIEFQDISLSFKEKVVFNRFNMKISQGHRVSIRGDSGRGKSSILKLIQGYLSPNSGTILIDGEKLSHNSISQLREKMTWVPQNINLPVNNGNELIELMQIVNNRKSIESFLGQLDLDPDYLRQDFNEISGGQKQRIIISIILSLRKPILLMDEPTSSLDEKSIRRLVKLVETLDNTTVISASHNQSWLDCSDKVIQL